MSATIQQPRPAWVVDPSRAYGREALRARLLGAEAAAAGPLGHLSWIVPLAAAVLAGILRFWNLDEPHAFAFDETYYIKDAYSLLQSGYERQWRGDANDAFLAGSPSPLEDPSYVVHPPLGKWMIALGMVLFGTETGFAWRFGPALFGTLTVLLVALAAQRLFSNVALGGVAGLLTAVDGHHLVMSRTALLDVFLAFFVTAAFLLLLVDRSHGRRLLADRLSAAAGRAGGVPAAHELLYGPWLAWRPWRLAAGLALGGACAVKWSALAFVAVFGLMSVLWDLQSRRAAGVRRWAVGGLLRDGAPAFLTVMAAAAAAYLASWTGWLSTSGGYDRQWAREHPGEGVPWLPAPLRSLAEYHRSAYQFHQGLSSDHEWESSPWSWLAAGRPVVFYRTTVPFGEQGCAAAECQRVVNDLPNPVLWWAAALSLLVVLMFWIGRRDWRAGAILSGILAGYLPWFMYPERTMFFFYTVAFLPFMVLALVYVLGLASGPPGAPARRRRSGAAAVGFFLAAVLVVSAFFWPVWTGDPIPVDSVRLRTWMPSWA